MQTKIADALTKKRTRHSPRIKMRNITTCDSFLGMGRCLNGIMMVNGEQGKVKDELRFVKFNCADYTHI
jgi:hypothetical protein